MKIVTFAVVLLVGLAAAIDGDSVPEVPGGSLQLADSESPNAPLEESSDIVEPAAPAYEDQQADVPDPALEERLVHEEQPKREEEPTLEQHPAEGEEPRDEAPERDPPSDPHRGPKHPHAHGDHSESDESEESGESGGSNEELLIVQEIEERQHELEYLKRYLIGRLIPIEDRFQLAGPRTCGFAWLMRNRTGIRP